MLHIIIVKVTTKDDVPIHTTQVANAVADALEHGLLHATMNGDAGTEVVERVHVGTADGTVGIEL
jgi:hypothetical protein